KRMAKIPNEKKKKMQSNGSLMRAAPLALINKKYSKIDCDLTNPNKINREINLIHVCCLKLLLKGKKRKDVKRFLLKYRQNICQSKTVKKILKQILKGIPKDNPRYSDPSALVNKIGRKLNEKGKGWVLTSFYLAYSAFLHYKKFTKALKWIIDKNPKSDTD